MPVKKLAAPLFQFILPACIWPICDSFRNYTRLDADFAPGFHLLLGDNAQGKTKFSKPFPIVICLGQPGMLHLTHDEHGQEIEAAIRALPPQEREKLVEDLPAILPEMNGDAAWERIITDPRPRPRSPRWVMKSKRS